MVVAPGDYHDCPEQNQVLSKLGGFMGSTFNLATTEGEPERCQGAVWAPERSDYEWPLVLSHLRFYSLSSGKD